MASRTDDPVVNRSDLLARGLSDHQIRRARERGELRTVLPGVYLRAVPDPPSDPAERHRATLTVVVPLLSGHPVVSHLSAAIMHGLPFCHSEIPWLGQPRQGEIRWLGRTRAVDPDSSGGPASGGDGYGRPRPGDHPPMHVTRPDAAKSRRGAAVQLHKAALAQSEVVELGGLPVTTPERTVVDCALTLPFDHAVMLADAALHRGLVSRDSLARQLDRLHRVPGTRRASDAVSFADPRSSCPGESLSRVLLHRRGLPEPELNEPITDVDGRVLARVAFAFPGTPVVGEFTELAPDPATAPDERATALRDAGRELVRWSWPDLRNPDALLDRLRTALSPVRERP